MSGMLSAPLYGSPGINDGLASSNNGGLENLSGVMNLSEIIPPPQVHDPNPNMEQHLLRQQQQSLQEEHWQRLRLLQQHQQQRQSQQQQFTSQQQQEIIRNATAVMGTDFRSNHHQQQNNHMHIQHQPTQMHMDQLKINRQNDKRKLQEQLEMLQNQQTMNEYNQNQHQQMQQQQQQQYQSRSGIRESLTNKLKDIYAGTDANLEPFPMTASTPNNTSEAAAAYVPEGSSNGGNNGDCSSSKRRESRGPGIVRENSLKMESIFENGCDNDDSGGISGGTDSIKKKYNTSGMSGMSMSNMSLGFEEESNLSAYFDQSMKLQGSRNNPRFSERNDSSAPLGMNLEPLPGEKSSSSMSTDSSLVLGHVFDDK